MLDLVFKIITFYAPAYVANGITALTYYFYKKGIKDFPLDRGKKFIDGRRILGDSRTLWELFLSISIASVVGFIEGLLFGGIAFYTLLGFLQGIGVVFGSISNSFFKRRLNTPVHKLGPSVVLDWTNHILGATLFSLLLIKIEFWFFLYTFIFTLIVHPIFVCKAAYKLGFKRHPW
jgi:CDP-2,3-bis-(O-geranylgeranyl)-sn-glycerol synthase